MEYINLTGTPDEQSKRCSPRPPGSYGLGLCYWRRVCVATSADGITWRKPRLGVTPWAAGTGSSPPPNSSTQNNIVMESKAGAKAPSGEECSVFVDGNPSAPAAQKWKMMCGAPGGLYSSPDGLTWSAMNFTATSAQDSMPNGGWDENLKKYVLHSRLCKKCLDHVGTSSGT